MKKNKKILLLSLFVLIGIIFFLFYFSTKANRTVAEGDQLLLTKPIVALEKYDQAQEQWPLLRYDKNFEKKIELAKREIENNKKIPAITIFLKNKTNNNQVQTLIKEVSGIKGVNKIQYISKEKAFQIYKDQNKDDPFLIEGITPDLLPASIEIYLNDSTLKTKITQLANDKIFIEKVIQARDY